MYDLIMKYEMKVLKIEGEMCMAVTCKAVVHPIFSRRQRQDIYDNEPFSQLGSLPSYTIIPYIYSPYFSYRIILHFGVYN